MLNSKAFSLKRKRTGFIMLLLLGVAGYITFPRVWDYFFPPYPPDMATWNVGVITPTVYPAMVKEVYGIHHKKGWKRNILFFGGGTLSKTEISRARDKVNNQNYSGFGLPLNFNTTTLGSRLFRLTHVDLPDEIYLYWIGYNDDLYLTNFTLDDAVKRFISTPGIHTKRDPNGTECWYNHITFGLLPDGRAKVWLEGCFQYKYVTTLNPIEAHKADSVAFHRKEALGEFRAERMGVEIEPIPWDEVEKVYHSDFYDLDMTTDWLYGGEGRE